MSKYGGSSFELFLLDGYNIISILPSPVSSSKESLTQQSNPFGVGNEAHTPINVEKGGLSIGEAIFDASVDALLSVVGATRGVSRLICVAFEGNTIGKHFTGYSGVYDQKYEVLDKIDNLVRANYGFLVSGVVEEGVIVQNLATYTADWDTKTGGAGATDAPVDYTTDVGQRVVDISSNSVANPTVITASGAHGLTTGDTILISGSNSTPTIDGERTVTVISSTTFSVAVNVTVGGTAGSFVKADSNAGGSGYCEATAYTGFTGCIPKINHSPDDITYAELIAFTDFAAVAGPKKERKTVTGTVDRYLASWGDVTGAGSVTIFMGFCRN